MYRRVAIFIIVVAVAVAMPASSEPLTTSMEKILQLFRGYLSEDDLTPASTLTELLSFAEAKDPYAFPDLVIKNEYLTTISGYEVIIRIRFRQDESWNDTIMTMVKIESVDELRLQHELYDTLIRVFGKPSKVVDCGFLANPPSKGTAVSAVDAEWKRGPRRLRFSSANLFMSYGKFMPIVASLQVSDTGLRQDLEDLVYLKLVSNATATAKSKNLMTVVVDLNNRRLLTPDWISIGSITELTSSKLSAEWGKDSTITIDRFSGVFDLDLVDSSLPNGKQRISGAIERVEPEKARVF